MNWLFFTIITSLCYGCFNVFMKIASGFGVESKVGTLILNLVATITIILYLSFSAKKSLKSLNLLSLGAMFAMFAGLMAAIGNTSRFISSFGSMTITYVISFLFLKESFSIGKLIGLFLGYVGIYLAIVN